MIEKAVDRLLTENSPRDAQFATEAGTQSYVQNTLSWVKTDCVEAVEVLKQDADYKSIAQTDRVLQDLNRPGMDGWEFLKRLKDDDDLPHPPVVLLTASQTLQASRPPYNYQENCYISNPTDHRMRVSQAIDDVWLTSVKLPEKTYE